MLRKDVRKSSYYVWSLGTELAKGFRGSEVVDDALRRLLSRLLDNNLLDPIKVTLQVSHKGVKVLQNSTYRRNSKPEVKEFIPRDAIMLAEQAKDIVGFIVFLCDFEAQWPLKMYAYRCDSVETAHNLKNQLQVLISQLDHHQKIMLIEDRLKARHRQQHQDHTINMNLHSGTASSESSAGSSSGEVASLYMSLAAELRQKLSVSAKVPLLLPPKDYDSRAQLDRKAASSSRIYSSGMDSKSAVRHIKSDDDSDDSLDDDPVPFSAAEKEATNIWQNIREKECEVKREHSLNTAFVKSSPVSSITSDTNQKWKSIKSHQSPAPSQLSINKVKSESCDQVSPHIRFKDAKEKFLLLERECLSEQEKEIAYKIIRPLETPIPTAEKGDAPLNERFKIKTNIKYLNRDLWRESSLESGETNRHIHSCHECIRSHDNGCVCDHNMCHCTSLSKIDERVCSGHPSYYSERNNEISKNKFNDLGSYSDCKYECQNKHFKPGYVLKDSSIVNSPDMFCGASKIPDWQGNQLALNVHSENVPGKLIQTLDHPNGNSGIQMLNSSLPTEYSYLNGRKQINLSDSLYNKYHKTRIVDRKKDELVGRWHLMLGTSEYYRPSYSNETDRVSEQKYNSDSDCFGSSMREEIELRTLNQVTRRPNFCYQELSDNERFPGLDRETARLHHHNHVVHPVSSESDSERINHRFVEKVFRGSGENINSSPIQRSQQKCCNASASRVHKAEFLRY